MPVYQFKAYDRTGRLQEVSLDAATREAALAVAHSRGLFPTEVREIGRGQGPASWRARLMPKRALSTKTLALLTREIATLVKAELPIDVVLQITALQPLIPETTREIVKSLLDQVTEGKAFHAALAQSGRFPEFYWRLVQSGESSGELGPVLERLASHLERRQELHSQVVSAVSYPAFLILAALASISVICAVLLPAIGPLFDGTGKSPPALVEGLLAIQRFVAQQWALLLILLLAGIALVGHALRQSSVRDVMQRAILSIPVVSSFAAQGEIARFCRALGAMLESGVPILEAMTIASRAQSLGVYARAIDAASADVARGVGLAQALRKSDRFTDLSLRLISVGEQTGQLEVMLARVAEIYEAGVERDLKRLTALLSPALTLIIGLLVGGIMLSVLQALVSINDLALQ